MLINFKNYALVIPIFFIKPRLLVEYTTNQYLHNKYTMHGTGLIIFTCQTNNNTKNVNVPFVISSCQLLKSTMDVKPNYIIPIYQP